jgi:tripartite-type tricarboxylate transporter receptor subunit TctC
MAMRRRGVLALAMAAAARPGQGEASAAEGWSPSRPIRVVYPYPPGGGGDIVSRLVAEPMRETLGQPLLVENRPGAAGLIGAELVARAPKDGHTLLITAAALSIAPSVYRRATFDPAKDLVAVALLTRLPLLVLVRAESPLRGFDDWIAQARREGDRVTYGSFGIGSPPHLTGERILQETGVRMTHVPYAGGSVAMPALLAGDLTVAILDGMSMLPHVQAGRLRALAVSASARMPQLPGVPTLRECGVAHDLGTWHGAFLPAGTPPEAVERLNDAFVRALALPAIRDRIVTGGAVPVEPPLSPAGWQAAFLEEIEAWGAVARRAGVVVE